MSAAGHIHSLAVLAAVLLLLAACASQPPAPRPQPPADQPVRHAGDAAAGSGQAQVSGQRRAASGQQPASDAKAPADGSPAADRSAAKGRGGKRPSKTAASQAGESVTSPRQRALAHALEHSLNKFDKRMRHKQAQIEVTEASGRAAGASNRAAGASVPPPPGGIAGAANGQPSNPAQDTSGGAGDRADVAGNVPDNIPSGENDDIVAAQLREAAMNAEDPELRKKLWEEYRQYKASH